MLGMGVTRQGGKPGKLVLASCGEGLGVETTRVLGSAGFAEVKGPDGFVSSLVM